jgi:PadR family transcriptional regulator, regulatory protein PadR
MKLTHFERTALQAVKELDRSAYGLQVWRKLQESEGFVAIGAVYVTMDNLEQRGLVQSQREPGGPERGGRDRVYWCLTADGFRALGEG